jgi:protein gp37
MNMAQNSKIEWTDCTWNPTSGCRAYSPGCANCYAAAMTYRLESMGQKKYAALTVLQPSGRRHFNGEVRPDESSLGLPFGWKKPRRVFVNSMSDLFYGDDADRRACESAGIEFKPVPFEFIDRVFAVMALTPQHTYQILTKRADRMAEYFNHSRDVMGFKTDERVGYAIAMLRGLDPGPRVGQWPLRNVWLGTSVENQKTADERIPHLLKCPAAVRFLSAEPLLGALDLRMHLHKRGCPEHPSDGTKVAICGCTGCRRDRIHWVIVGGESGPNARPMHPDWARSIRDQCQQARVPFFFKQWGEWTPGENAEATPTRTEQTATWFDERWTFGTLTPKQSEELHVDDQPDLFRLGKKAAGRMLDGREWSEFPVVASVTGGAR